MGGLGDRAPWDLTLLTLLTFPLWGAKKGYHKEMLIMSIMLNPFYRKMFLAGEMLIMLIMLNQIRDSWVYSPMGFNIISIVNISPAGSRKCFCQGKC